MSNHDEQHQHSPDSVTRLELGGRTILLLGTAHVSRRSVEQVQELVADEAPDRVCVEIDEGRYASLSEENAWRKLNIYEVLKRKQGFLLLGNLVMASFQRRIGKELGVRPGAEMVEAVQIAEANGIPVSLADRQIQITLKRAWASGGFWGKSKMMAALLTSFFGGDTISESDIEALKEKDALNSMMEELAGYLPRTKKVLIDERDRYLASRIYEAEGDTILAVVGAGHVPGIVSTLHALESGSISADVTELDRIPPKGPVAKALPWVLPAAVAAIFVTGFLQSGWVLARDMLVLWVLVNGSLSALGAALAFAHPLTVLTSFVAAPITSMNPTIGVGFVAGFLEAVFRKPRVSDFESLQDDISSFRGFFRNRITRILLVFAFSTLGSAIGTFIGIPYLTSLLGG
ncbi:MAG: TraB/GumN family protein [bacterium]